MRTLSFLIVTAPAGNRFLFSVSLTPPASTQPIEWFKSVSSIMNSLAPGQNWVAVGVSPITTLYLGLTTGPYSQFVSQGYARLNPLRMTDVMSLISESFSK